MFWSDWCLQSAIEEWPRLHAFSLSVFSLIEIFFNIFNFCILNVNSNTYSMSGGKVLHYIEVGMTLERESELGMVVTTEVQLSISRLSR